MTPGMYSNAVEILLLNASKGNMQAPKESAQLWILWSALGLLLFFIGWWIREQIKKNDLNNTANFKEIKDDVNGMKDNMSGVKDGIHEMSLKMAEDYLRTVRFEKHETENKSSIERIHERIDGIKGAPVRAGE